MTVLVIGATGMLGHQICLGLGKNFEVVGLARRASDATSSFARLLEVADYDITEFATLEPILDRINPDVVINCAGAIKQRTDISESNFVAANSLFPHRLAEYCVRSDTRMIHFSTDCVFSGKHGPYTIEHTPDPVDTYGRSKLLGEVDSRNCLTLRTSIIGHELDGKFGLLEWFLSQRGKAISGFTNALYSGVTTIEIVRFMQLILTKHENLHGIWHLASEPISKFDLLCLVRDVYHMEDTIIQPSHDFRCDRRLDGTPLTVRCKYKAPSWRRMIEELHISYKSTQVSSAKDTRVLVDTSGIEGA